MIAKTLTLAAANSSLPLFACASLMLFFTTFVVALVWVHRRGANETYARVSQLPLESTEVQP